MTGERQDDRSGTDERRDLADDGPPICGVCGVTMVPAELSAGDTAGADWVCLECEETGRAEDR